jgi:hypothetical protein
MARPRNNAKHLNKAVEELLGAVTRLIGSIESALPRGGATAGAAVARVPGQRGPGKNNPKLKSAIKASWARMTPAERKERVRRMLAGRGLKPKRA